MTETEFPNPFNGFGEDLAWGTGDETEIILHSKALAREHKDILLKKELSREVTIISEASERVDLDLDHAVHGSLGEDRSEVGRFGTFSVTNFCIGGEDIEVVRVERF
jgi:hypothetical protein